MSRSQESTKVVERYDVLILVKRYSAVGPSNESREWLALDGSLADAQQAMRRVHDDGGLAIVVPTRYRAAQTTEEDAKAIAQAAFDGIYGDQKGAFSELSDGSDDGAFWHFTVQDPAAQARGLIPGTKSFMVDKLDGRLWSPMEATEFWRLSVLS